MSFDATALTEAIRRHGRVARVAVAAVTGSAPREPGAAMLVWPGGQSGTIGGGALEFEAAARARARLVSGAAGPWLERMPLGPALGQCCGGAVMLLTEAWDAAALRGAEAAAAGDGVFARPVAPGAGARPLAVRRAAALAASGGDPAPVLEAGWFAEAAARPTRDVWLWGAGHVGRALAEVLAPLPGLALSWVDTGPERFPEETPAGVTVLPAAHPPDLVAHAPRDAEHLIMTHSHALDLELCHRLLSRGFARCGLIGSATKRVRFCKRLEQLGHRPAAISRIDCPIGAPELGKHPQAIAVGVAGDLLRVGAAARDDRTEAAG